MLNKACRIRVVLALIGLIAILVAFVTLAGLLPDFVLGTR